jgi:DNA-binding MarR family transcriptional regulator
VRRSSVATACMRVSSSDQTSRSATTTILNSQKSLKIWSKERGRVTNASDQQEAAEQLALVLTNHGLQRMTARVLAALLFTDQPTMTMGELAVLLQASSGAISGAVKMLTSVGLVERVPAPSSRRDHYRLRDDAWALLYTNQNAVLAPMLAAAEAGIAAAGHDSLAGRRLTQMRDFYAFLLAEIPALLDRWQQQSAPRAR